MRGCGTKLLDKNGNPDFSRKFCGKECLTIDKKERMQVRRGNAKKNGRCSSCGQILKVKGETK
jgi:hypothetical protein